MYRLFILIPAFLLATFSIAEAGTQTSSPMEAPVTASTPVGASSYQDSGPEPVHQADLISFGAGFVDFDKSEPHRFSGDLRAEYRWGMSLLPMITPYFKKWDPYVQFHPMAGVELGTLGQLYGAGGWAMDAYFGRHVIFTWSETAGLYYPGDAVRLGSILEFRSMAEIGWQFDNQMRVTAEVSHISNAKITEFNPGSEMAGIYLHVPVGMMFQ